MNKKQAAPDKATRHEYAYLFNNHPIKWFLNLIHPVRGRYLTAIVLDLAFVACSIVPATMTGLLVDQVLTQRKLNLLPLYLGLLVGVPLFRSCLSLLFRYLFEFSSQNSIMRLRESLYRHLQELDATFYDKAKTGDIMSKMTGDIDWVRHFTAYTAYAAVESVVMFAGGMIYLMTISWKLALSALIVSPFIMIIMLKFGQKVMPAWRDVRESFSRLNSAVQQNIAGNRIVRAFVRADFEEKKFEAENDGYRKANIHQASVAVRYAPILDALAYVLTVPVILVGGWLVIRGEMSLGGLVTFNGLLFILNQPMRNAGNLINETKRFATSAGKIIDLLMEKPRICSPDVAGDGSPQKLAGPARGKVEFRDVSLVYGEARGKESRPALDHVSLVAEPGQTIGIVGLTGSGKTSLASLIPRLYDPTGGAILIDDVDIRKYNLQELRRSIGMVMQDVFLFSDTVEGNIAYGVPDAPIELVEHVASLSATAEFVGNMAQKYDTIVGERGVGLSGGQRQRIALARALAMRPRILILDDTTSAVDMETENEIQQALRKEPGTWTTFIIAHRISSVRHADQILVMDHGRIIERGKHEELLALERVYHDIFLTQAGLERGRDDGA